jgi:hypothetical protein
MKITNSHSGDSKYFKGRGRSGKKTLDDYQKLLLEQQKLNQLESEGKINQPRQKPLTGKAKKDYDNRIKNTMERKGRSI